jgi:hypothetical protein
VKIEKTKVVSKDIMVAKLSGSTKATIAVVRDGEKYKVVAPAELGGTRAVPADSMTDCLHQAVYEMAEAAQKPKKKNTGGRKP